MAVTFRRRLGGAFKVAVMLPMLAVAAGCENPVSSTRHDAPAGIRLVVGETVVVSGSATALEGSISLTPGHALTPVTVQFTNVAGDVIDRDGTYWLKVTSSSGSVVQWSATPEGAFTGAIQAAGVGTATLRFEYYHGAVGRGHRDGDAFDIPVTVVSVT